MNTTWKLQIGLMVLVLTACGRKDDEAKDEGIEQIAGGNVLLSDDTLSAEAASSQLDEAISGAATDPEVESYSLASDVTKDITNDRSCVVNDQGVLVKISRSYEASREYNGAIRTTKSSLIVSGEHERQWSKAGATLACNASGKHISLAGVNMKDMKLAAKFSRSRTHSFSATNRRSGVSVESSRKFTASGTRDIAWTADDTVGTEITRTKSITSSVTRTLEAQNKSGKTVSLKSEIATKSGAPLVVKVVRDATNKAWSSKTIVSGTSVAKHADGSRVEQVFDNVKFTSAEKCNAVSGNIVGNVYESHDATEIKKSFKISFADGVATITFADGTQKEITQDGCDLENANEAAE